MSSPQPVNPFRRQFLQVTASASLCGTLGIPALSSEAATTTRGNTAHEPRPKSIPLDECLSLSPQQMAQRSPIAQRSFAYINECMAQIQDGALKSTTRSMVNHPAPTLMAYYLGQPDRQDALFRNLKDKNLLAADVTREQLFPPCKSADIPAQPMLSAPGSDYNSHHSYPGGLCAHTATNLRHAIDYKHTYEQLFRYSLSLDVLFASQTLHDLQKTWVFQWRDDGSCLKELTIGDTGAHHIFGLAQCMVHDLPADVILAQACAHTNPGVLDGEKKIVGWLTAAAMIARVDPVAKGYVTDQQALPKPHKQEWFVSHICDYDFVFANPAAKDAISVLKDIAKEDYGMTERQLDGRDFNSFRNYLGSQISWLRTNFENSNDVHALRQLIHATVVKT
ncbi:hypothetical protein K7N18_28215 [Burkholderia arboris]|uniref:hypothetical protein n=1 Tax=Burkholderia arboris TaxID=488730 RepID=UPI001CA3D1F7|nr:hypothetical protein [Burkholderia arboris]MBY8608715.1 hypothetical protein [Burkholderia arboris]